MLDKLVKQRRFITFFSFTSFLTILVLLWAIFGYILDRDVGFLVLLIIFIILTPSSVGALVFFSIRFVKMKKRIKF